MPTAAELAYFTDKKLMGFEDFEDRFLRYLQNHAFETTKRLFIQGAFDERMPLSGSGANQVQVDLKPILGDGFCHDGAGHLIDLEQISRVAQFENVTGTTYEVGVGYVEYPYEIRVNPRTGKPEYDRLIEGVGVEADPDSVTNNGSNLTFRVDSLFEQGVAVPTHAGRLVRVFKKIPDGDASTASVAIETATVFFGGGQNQITTTGLFGQSTVSTDPSDYTVQLVGIIVLKDTATNRPTLNPSTNFFVGTVDGNTGVAPSSFDISAQAVIQPQGAAGITLSPYTGAGPISWEIASVDVQNAIEEIVDDLTNVGAGTDGVRLIGANGSTYTQTNPSASLSWGGLGTNGDTLFDKLTDADRQLARSRFASTHSASQATIQADEQGADGIASLSNEQHWLKGAGDLVISNAVTDIPSTGVPGVQGESIAKTRLVLPDVGGFNMYGRIADMSLVPQNNVPTLGESGVFIGERLRLAQKAFHMGHGAPMAGPSGALGYMQPHILRDSVMLAALSGAGVPGSEGFRTDNQGGMGVKLIENTVFENTEDTTSCLRHIQNPSVDSAYSTTIYRNCIFRNAPGNNVGDCLWIDGPGAIFINCKIVHEGDLANSNTAVFLSSNAYGALFVDCEIRSHNGNCVRTDGALTQLRAEFRGCKFAAVDAAKSGGSFDPDLLQGERLRFINCEVEVGESAIRTSGASSAFVSLDTCEVNDMRIVFADGLPGIHDYTNMEFVDCKIRDLYVKLYDDDAKFGSGPEVLNAMSGSEPALLWFDGCHIDGFEARGWFQMAESQALSNWSVIHFDDFNNVYRFRYAVFMEPSTATGLGLLGVVTFGSTNRVENIHVEFDNNGRPQMHADYGMFDVPSVATSTKLANMIVGEFGAGIAWMNDTQGDSDVLIRVSGSESEIYNIRSTAGNFEADLTWIVIDGGRRLKIWGCWLRQRANAANTRRMIWHRSNDDVARYVLLTDNHMFWRSAGSPPTDDKFIDLSGALENIIDNNFCLNQNATIPVIYNGSGTIGDNILDGSATF